MHALTQRPLQLCACELHRLQALLPLQDRWHCCSV
jgi:hypothetical protein